MMIERHRCTVEYWPDMAHYKGILQWEKPPGIPWLESQIIERAEHECRRHLNRAFHRDKGITIVKWIPQMKSKTVILHHGMHQVIIIIDWSHLQ